MARLIAGRIRAWRGVVRPETPGRIRALAMFVQAGVEFEFLRRREDAMLGPTPIAPGPSAATGGSPLPLLIAQIRREPSKIGRQLRRTPEGCRWMIEQWKTLGDRLINGATWNATERDVAFDLLGTPVAFRDDRPGENVARKNVGLTAPLPGETPGPPLHRGQLLALIRQQIEQLEARVGDLARPATNATPTTPIAANELRTLRDYRRQADEALDRMARALNSL